jgi:legumain
MRYTLAASVLAAVASAKYNADHAAVLVAGSSGYWNYRHQADIAHAYQILLNDGMDPDNIIVFMYDDIANNYENPFPGQLFNKPDGEDVYAGLKIDYKGRDVTPEKFLAVLTGDSTTAGGKVLNTNSNSRVFVNFSDHGGVGLIAFPHEYLYADQLQSAIDTMEQKGMYKEMTFYIEACESGSMFPNLRSSQNVYAMTASNASLSSWAAYCSPQDMVNGVEIGSCLGDEFSVNWMEDSDSHNPLTETLRTQHNTVKNKTQGSPVQVFGDMDFLDETLGEWQGNQDGNASFIEKSIAFMNVDHVSALKSEAPKSMWDSRDVKMHYLTRRAAKNGGEEAHVELMDEIQKRMDSDKIFNQVFASHANEELVFTPQNFDCLRYLIGVHDESCGKFDDYSLKYVRHLVHACET